MTTTRPDRCSYVLGPCVDGTMAGKRCSDRATVGGRCDRHGRANDG